MSVLALLLALLALIAAPLSILVGAVLLVLAAGAGVVDVRRRPGRRVLAVASVIALLAFET